MPPGESITRGGHIWRMTTSGYGTGVDLSNSLVASGCLARSAGSGS